MVTSVGLYLGILAALVVERLFELGLSRHNAALSFQRGAHEHGVAHYRVMAAVHTVFLVSCAAEVLWLHRPFIPLLFGAGLSFALLSQGLRYWAIRSLGDRWNVRIIVEPGRPPVTAGPYRFLRHPNYVAVIVEMLAVPLMHSAWITAVVFSAANALLLRTRIRSEETAMGDLYRTTFAAHRRLVPTFARPSESP